MPVLPVPSLVTDIAESVANALLQHSSDRFLVTLGSEYVYLGYAGVAAALVTVILMLRRMRQRSSFFRLPSGARPAASQASGRPSAFNLEGGNPALLEVDASTNFERAVREFATEKTSQGGLVYAFTSKGSPVNNALTSMVGVRFYLLSSKVSYPKPSAVDNELLIPQGDFPVMLDLLDKTITSTGETPVSIVFDSLSDFILSQGFDACYKFLKQAIEIVSRPKVSMVFLMTISAHDDKVANLIKSVFRMHLAYGAKGLRATRIATVAG
jgi:hypothetical protein